MLALKGRRACGQGVQAPLEAGKRQEAGSPLEFPELEPLLAFDLQNCKIAYSYCFKAQKR